MKHLVLLLACALLPAVLSPAAPATASAGAGWVTPFPPYPTAARVLREQGRTAILVRTGPDGRVAEVRLQPGTGSRTLDEATVAFVRSRWRGPANQSRVTAVDFRLSGSAPPPRPGASIQAPTPPPSAPGPTPSHDGRVHLLVFVGPAGRAERIRVTASLGTALDGAAADKVRKGYVGTPMSVQSLTFSP